MIFENKLSEQVLKCPVKDFINAVDNLAIYLQIKPNWLMYLMNAESGLNPAAYNPDGGATGLIQFMPDTARSLGTTTEQLAQMDAVTQLTYVRKYFQPFQGKIHSYYDLYLIDFFPAAIGKSDSWVFQASGLPAELIAKSNPAISKYGDGKVIRKSDFKKYVAGTVPKTYHESLGIQAGIGAGEIILAAAGAWLLTELF